MIQVSHMSYTYAGAARPAVSDVSFDVAPGEIFGLLGPSGAGKSTTQKVLIGLLKGYEGAAGVFGRDVRAWGQDYYERVGVCFETPSHYLKLTALENLSYFRSLYSGATEAPREVLKLVNLEEDADKPAGRFSKGMSIRLNLARALLNKPALLFLDEPTAGLDPANARQIKNLIQAKQEEGVTIFLTTHNMALAEELCDRVAFIVDGQIRLIDTPRALKLRYGQRLIRVEYGADGHTQQKEYALDGLGENADFLDLLRHEPIQTLHTEETTLENIFIQVTGRSLT
jgi:fluoroquinolone transport system ATP-binding protein